MLSEALYKERKVYRWAYLVKRWVLKVSMKTGVLVISCMNYDEIRLVFRSMLSTLEVQIHVLQNIKDISISS